MISQDELVQSVNNNRGLAISYNDAAISITLQRKLKDWASHNFTTSSSWTSMKKNSGTAGNKHIVAVSG